MDTRVPFSLPPPLSLSLSLSLGGVKNVLNRTPFRVKRSSTNERSAANSRFHASDVDLVARSMEREPRYIR